MRTALLLLVPSAALALLAATGCGGATPEPAVAQDADTAGAEGAKSDSGPSPEVHKKFMTACSGSGAGQNYCDCAWEVSVDVLPAEALAADKLSPELDAELTKALVDRCWTKMPEPQLREGYMQGCMATGTKTFCDCAWNKLRGQMSTTEIVTADTKSPEFSAAAQQVAKECIEENPEAGAEMESRAGFMKGCVKGNEAKLPLCSCAWTTLRDKYSIQQIQQSNQSPPPDWQATLEKIREDCSKAR